jgi:hypothetical protein
MSLCKGGVTVTYVDYMYAPRVSSGLITEWLSRERNDRVPVLRDLTLVRQGDI